MAIRPLVLLLAVCAALPAGSEPERDALDDALAAMGIAKADLGYRPPAHWGRYPHPKTTPYMLPFFEDLHARPLDTYGFTRTLGNAVIELLTPEKLREAPDEKDRKETLFRLGVVLGTDRLLGGFRGYSANLDPEPWEGEPLLHACETLLERSGKPLRRPMSFGAQFSKDEPSPRAKLRADVDKVPGPLQLPLARLLLNLIDAREWIDVGLRDVPSDLRDRLFAALPALLDETPDGTGYDPVFDDIAKRIDQPSLYYGCLKALQAVEDARREIPAGGQPAFRFRLETPWGAVRFDNEGEADRRERDPFLVVDFAGRGAFRSPLGATGPRRTLSVALLLEHEGMLGDGGAVDVQEEGGTAELASGILGCGIVYASGDRGNSYVTGRYGLGFGMFGLGALVDEGGCDTYKMAAGGEGAGIFGIGLLFDAGGDDAFRLLEGDGEGYGGPGGIGVLADRSGDDRYFAERDALKAGRADYHSADRIAANNAQGAGFGRRGDGSDGHNWAGGLGALLDAQGNDTYEAGNFSQGIGYWYGTGLLWDGGGDDRYESVYFTQGSGAHFAIGALIDEAGNDRHTLLENAGAGLGFGWDVVNAFLIDRGAGNDRYEARIISTGLAEVRSNAFLLDEGGDDTYVLDAGTKGFGDVDERPEYGDAPKTSAASFYLTQAAVFLDLGGKDTYLRRPDEGEPAPDAEAGDNRRWHVRRRDPAAESGFNVSFAADLEAKPPRFLAAWPSR
ncbi:MAG TPA: hypothetical protein VFY93_15150 [Planctomycetota bacterium]|nr:hypothetical protein [Planctomycetota bacterium]